MEGSFSDIGTENARRRIALAESGISEPQSFEMKPFTTKVPPFFIEALDLIASDMEITRNALVTKLVARYLGHAYQEYEYAYWQECGMIGEFEKSAITSLELLFSKNEPSPEARKLLADSLAEALGIS